MVSYKQVLASNALITDATAPRVAVFVGGTSGIGKFTIKAVVGTGTSPRIYLVGRKSAEERMQPFIQELRTLNPKAEIIWTEAEVSLLADVKRVCDIIKSKESHVDLLFLTPGYAPFGPRVETAEGLEVVQSLEVYSRMLFILQLSSLLSAADAPRVVSVLAGGLESTRLIDLDDLDLKKPGNFNSFRARVQNIVLHTMMLDKFASEHPNVTLVHSWPGGVNTGNAARGWAPGSVMGWVFPAVIGFLFRFVGFSDDESGQRHLFESTSAAFGGRGVPWTGKEGVNTAGKSTAGLFLVSNQCECTPNAKVVDQLREKGQAKIWDHTRELLAPYL